MRLFFFFLLLPVLISAQHDMLLSDFGDNGVAKFERGYSSSIRCLMPLSDGRIVVYASWSDSVFQIRLKPNGALDSTFGVNGIQPDNYPKLSIPYEMSLLPNGQYFALRQYHEGTFIPQDGFGLTKHHLNGELDTTFGVGGMTHIILGNYAIPGTLAVQSDGKIVALGFRSGQVGVLTRFHANGQIDSTFDGNGVALAHIDFPNALALQPDGHILSAGARGGGYPDLKLALVRHKENGSLDSTFAENGSITTYFGQQTELASAVLLRPNGKIILGGSLDPLNSKFAIVQFNSDGTPDLSFGTNGLVTTSFPYGGGISRLALLNDGKILAFGIAQYVSAGPESPHYSVMVRYTENGVLDVTFGEQGIWKFIVGEASYISLQSVYSDGSFVLGGDYYPELQGPPHFYVARTAAPTSSSMNLPDSQPSILVYPNPATDRVVFQLPEALSLTAAKLNIYDLKGQLISTNLEEGVNYQLIWNSKGVLPGTYMYQLIMPDRVFTGKVVRVP